MNAYLKQITGQDFTTNDFRTWAGTVLALQTLQAYGACDSLAEARTNVVQAMKTVAAQLGNTAAICRKCYVHPVIIEAYSAGSLLQALQALTDPDTRYALHALLPH